MSTETISLSESKEFVQCEKQIKEGVFSAGKALIVIRDKKLYRADYSSFEEYCKDKWGYSRAQGYRLIDAFEVVESLPESVSHCVTNARQANALSKVPPPKRAAVIEEIKKTGKPVTAAAIKKAAPTPPPPKPKPAAPPKPAPEPEREKDEVGSIIPDELLGHWNRRHEIAELVNFAARVRLVIVKAQESDDLLFRDLSFQIALEGCDKLLPELKKIKPYALCPQCRGKTLDTCMVCKQSGFIGKFYWDCQTAEETKTIILKVNQGK